MNKKLYILAVLILGGLAFHSCGDSDNNYEIDQVWKDLQDKVYKEIADSAEFKDRECLTGNGTIQYKDIDFISTRSLDKFSTKITQDGRPYYNDSVVVRYEGWFYYEKDGERKKLIFDSTEGDNNAQGGRGFRVSKVIAGWSSALQHMDMKDNDEIQICLPYEIAYGTSGNSSGTVTIPGYTTLFFNIKLLKIIPLNPGEFPGVITGE